MLKLFLSNAPAVAPLLSCTSVIKTSSSTAVPVTLLQIKTPIFAAPDVSMSIFSILYSAQEVVTFKSAGVFS